MTDHWTDELPEELRGNETLKQSPDLNHALNRLIESRSTLGKALIPPGEDATDEQREKFGNRLQEMGYVPKSAIPDVGEVPDSADGYSYEGLPEEDPRREAMQKRADSLRAVLHAAGTPKAIAEKIIAGDLEVGQEQFNDMVQSANTGNEALKAALGDRYQTVIGDAQKGADYLGGVVGLAMADGSMVAIESNQRFIEMLSQTGGQIGEDGTKTPTTPGLPTEDLTDLDLKAKALFQEVQSLRPGDPNRDIKMRERFGVVKKIAAIKTGDASILNMNEEEFAKAVVSK